MKCGVCGVEYRDKTGMSRVNQTPQNMTWQADLNATNWRLTWHIKWGGYVAYGPGPNATYTIRHIFFLKSWCHAWHTHAWHTHFNMLSIICGAAFTRDISREVQIFLCTGGKCTFLPKHYKKSAAYRRLFLPLSGVFFRRNDATAFLQIADKKMWKSSTSAFLQNAVECHKRRKAGCKK